MSSPSEIDLLRRRIDEHIQVRAFDGRIFIPKRALHDYLTKDRIKKLLDVVHLPRYKWDAIRSNYLAIFVIWLLNGRGNSIMFFLPYDYLSDAQLPFRNCENWPEECRHLYKDFEKVQWAFCAQELRSDRLDDKRFDANTIIPITSRNVLKKGSNSETYKVAIHPEYDFLACKGKDSIHSTRTYVLKTCDANHDELHENEVRTYRMLSQNKDISNNIAHFYGSWKQNDSYNILLEYVDGGPDGNTLTDVFKGQHPTNAADLIQFWFSLVSIVDPICRLHCHAESENRSEVAVGVHQDVKSDNILKSQAKPNDLFNFTFKLTDWGLAYIPVQATKERINRGRDRPGTQMFGAPECFRDEFDPFDLRTTREVSPKKDIWSLGCVFSEALTWSALGRSGYLEYRELRPQATMGIHNMENTAYSGCFHDGKTISRAVCEMHDRVRRLPSTTSSSIPIVLNLIIPIVEDMLNADPIRRPDAPEVRRRFRQVLEAARRNWGKEEYPAPFRNEDEPIQTPKFPPPRAQTFSAVSTLQCNEPCFERSGDFLDCEGILGARANRLPPHGPGYLKRSATEGEQRISNTQPHSLHRPQSLNMRLLPNPVDVIQESENEPLENITPVSRHKIPLPSPSSTKGGAADVQNANPTTNEMPNTTSTTSSPQATVGEVVKWISNQTITKPVSDSYLAKLKGKDQVFIIDNSKSMKAHRPDVRKTFEALAYLVKGFDPDGIEMHFTNSFQVGHKTHRKKLLRMFDKVDFAGETSMQITLESVLDNPKKRWSKFLNRDNNKRRSIIVLTNGMWHGDDDSLCGVQDIIKRNVNKIGIQFIQFGNDRVGSWRLNELDNKLKDSHGVKEDVVDTEPYTGNVYKMLLGHLDSSWDGSKGASSDGSRQTPSNHSSSS